MYISSFYKSTVFLSSFLLFYIQPVLWKYFLIQFGWIYSVWGTIVLFFTGILLLWYILAQLCTLIRKPKNYSILLLFFLLIASLYSSFMSWYFYLFWNINLPFQLASEFQTIFFTLSIIIWIPYLFLSLTSPTLQYCYWNMFEKEPYKLYSVSNIWALFWILSYPFFIEPFFSIPTQIFIFWSIFLIYSFLFWTSIILYLRHISANDIKKTVIYEDMIFWETRFWYKKVFWWIVFPLIASMLLLIITNSLTQWVPATPFLWLFPLFLYTITYIIPFSGYHLYHRSIYVILILFIWVNCLSFFEDRSYSYIPYFLSLNLLLFFVSLACHYELYLTRPANNSHMIPYFIISSLWGILWTIWVVLIIPLLFSYNGELFFSVFFITLFWVLYLFFDTFLKNVQYYKLTLWLLLLFIIFSFWTYIDTHFIKENSIKYRNFYGSIRVEIKGDIKYLYNGKILHWYQYIDENKDTPTTYYGDKTAIWQLLLSEEYKNKDLQVGIIGLGVGTLGAYCKPGDIYTFYDINPSVITLAQSDFSYLEKCENLKLIEGDARIQMQMETNAYDIVVIDAFNDNSIPLHLVTQEAMELYLQQTSETWVIAFHISNNHLDLKPVLKKYVEMYNLEYLHYINEADTFSHPAEWFIFFKDTSVRKNIDLENTTPLEDIKNIALWTDNYNNMISILK